MLPWFVLFPFIIAVSGKVRNVSDYYFVLNPMYYENQVLPRNAVGDSIPFTAGFTTRLITGRIAQFYYV
jgi:hypothetical protein